MVGHINITLSRSTLRSIIDLASGSRAVLNICTIICRNYVAQARVLAASFKASYPDSECVVLVLDGHHDTDARNENFRTVYLEDLEISGVDVMAGIYDAIELSTAVKPWLLEWMLDQYGDQGPVAYFDPDIKVFSPMVELEAMLETQWAALTPHLTAPMPLDGREPSEQAILLAGTYNLGFIGLSDTADTRRFLIWWQDRLRWDCRVDPANGFFVDQRFVDFVPGLFDDVGVLRHPGYNVAYWNLATRTLEDVTDGTTTVNGEPLRFFHFSGFDPRRPGQISKHQDRVDLDAGIALRAAFENYAADLTNAGFLDSAGLSYGLARSANDRRITKDVRAAYSQATKSGFVASLFDEQQDLAFQTHLEELDGVSGIPQGFMYLWKQQKDLQLSFPDVRNRDRALFLRWCSKEDAGSTFLGGYLASPNVDIQEGTRKRASGVNVIGYLNAELGVGEAARSVVRLLDDAGIPVWPVPLPAKGSRGEALFRSPGGSPDLPFTQTLLCVNADMVPTTAPLIARAGLRDTRVTGLWWWETEDFPARFDPAFAWVDHVIAGSSFVANAIAQSGLAPVSSFPLPVEVGRIAASVPPEIAWPTGFTFYFSFDYNSVFERKNPLGLVQAFSEAFAPEDGANLVIKTINTEQHPVDADALKRAIAARSDISVIDGYLAEDVRNRLLAECDCYVSLHRSEGFGLTMAEAMYLGKPTIATGYSGNLDFMSEENSLLIPYTMREIGPNAVPYDPAGLWAEPDLAAAGVAMRRVFDDADFARQLGKEAAKSIRITHSTQQASAALDSILGGNSIV